MKKVVIVGVGNSEISTKTAIEIAVRNNTVHVVCPEPKSTMIKNESAGVYPVYDLLKGKNNE